MADIRSKVYELYSIEQLASNKTIIHQIHPMIKLITTLAFIVSVVSFNRYEIIGMVPYVFYPAIVMALGEIPPAMILKRSLIALPFCLFGGISNIIFDRQILFYMGNIPITWGITSCISILFKTLLCVSAILILVSVTTFTEISGQLRKCHIPDVLVTMIEMIYRYIGVLIGEASTMATAYSLRHSKGMAIEMKDMGTFVGQLLIRSFDRADRIYGAMVCRGLSVSERNLPHQKIKAWDVFYLTIVGGLIIFLRFFDLSVIFELIFGGLY